jgi:solute carrier family 15 (oligopeptide transporter), member 1
MSSLGLFIITFGSGCIKPSSNTFGGDQYNQNEVRSIALFFSLNYFVFNCGSIISRLASPYFRTDVKCFGSDDCYPLAFGVPGVMMLLGALILLAGRKKAVCYEAKGNMFLKFCGCIWVSF